MITSAVGEVPLGLESEDGEGEGDAAGDSNRNQDRIHLNRY